MQAPQMAPDAQAPANAPDAPGGGMPPKDATDKGDPIRVVKSLEEGIMNLQEALSKAGAPPELLKPLQQAVSSFGEFVSIFSGSVPPAKSGRGVQPQESMGAANAVPADMPRGGKARMVPA